MLKDMSNVRLLISFLIYILPVSGQVSLGKLVNNGHGLDGEVIILNERQYRIKGIFYICPSTYVRRFKFSPSFHL